MGLEHKVVDLELARARCADDRHAGDVCVVTLNSRTEVEEHIVTGFQLSRRRPVMRYRGVGTRLDQGVEGKACIVGGDRRVDGHRNLQL